MEKILLRTCLFLGIILLGFILKKLNLVGTTFKNNLRKLVLNITLPATIIYGFGDFHPDAFFFLLCLIGFLGNWIMIGLGLLLTRSQTLEAKNFYILSLAGYNIGCFSLPFAQSMFGPAGIVATCMFDIGNSIMCTGGTYAVAKTLNAKQNLGEPFTLKDIAKNLLGSIPFDTYLLMLFLLVTKQSLPASVLKALAPLAGINGYLSMLLLGVMMNLTLDRKKLKIISQILLTRTLAGPTLAILIFLFTPFELELKKVMLLTFLSPITVMTSIFVDKLEGNTELASLATSLSIITSVAAMMVAIVIVF